jgi:uncharacterized protein (TIGR00645 family)
MAKISNAVEIILFRARWLLVPLYVGLVAALVLLIYRFALEFVHMIENVGDADAHKFTLDLLALLSVIKANSFLPKAFFVTEISCFFPKYFLQVGRCVTS